MAAETRASDLDLIDTLLESALQRSVREMLVTARALARDMAEAQSMCEHAIQRLDDAAREASVAAPEPAMRRFAAIVETYAAFLSKFASQRGVYRLLHRRVVVRATLACHEDLDRVLLGLGLPRGAKAQADWRAAWEHLRDTQTHALDAIAHDGAALFGDVAVPAEALSFLSFELQRTSAAASSDAELQVLAHALETARRIAGDSAALPTIAPWLLPPYELTFEPAPFAWSSSGAVHVGSLGGADVAVKFVTSAAAVDGGGGSDRAVFVHEADAWHSASHAPNVIRLLGACDVGATPYFVAEYAALGPLPRVVADAAQRSHTWQLLLDAATGVAALHRLHLLHNDLRGDRILVVATGAGGSAKITGFRHATSVDAPLQAVLDRVGAAQWKAPEVLTKQRAPSCASDVYALGMCIIEAVARRPPWGDKADVTVRLLVTHGTLPPRPSDGFADDEWALVAHMCALRPEDRAPMGHVLERLREFASREAQWRHQRRESLLDRRSEGERDDVEPLRAAELVADLSARFAPLPLGAFDASLRERQAALKPSDSASASAAAFDPATSLPLSNFEWGAQSQSESRHSPRPRRRSSIEKVPSVVPELPVAPPVVPAPRPTPAEPLVRAASITNARFVTLEGSRQIVQYEVAIQLSAGKDVLVWKRFSAFRNFYRRIRSLHGAQMLGFPVFPSRFPLAGSKSLATVEHRSDALNAMLKAVVEDSDLPFGVLVSDRVSLFKAGTDRSDAVLL